MRIEHVAWQVQSPAEVANWYCRHLGFTVQRAADEPVPVRYIADESGRVMLEVYNNPVAPVPDYASMDPLVLHLAFVCDDVPGERRRLIDAGATPIGSAEISPLGDELAMLRDPWGLAIQLAHRAEPMV